MLKTVWTLELFWRGPFTLASQVIMADLCTSEGLALLHQWYHEFVVGIFLAPPCSASRARQMSLGKGHKHVGPRPLRDNNVTNILGPNGRPNLTLQERNRVSLANRLYHLAAELGQWAIRVGCLLCVESPQFSAACFGQQHVRQQLQTNFNTLSSIHVSMVV